jgi:hypothetical protein
MRSKLLIIIFLSLPFMSRTQDIVEDIFRKYSGNDNYTSITISNDLLNFVFTGSKGEGIHTGKISSLKILAAEHHFANSSGFTNEIIKDLNSNDYHNIMEIMDGKSKVNFYIKEGSGKICQFLMVAKGDDEEVMVSIKGEFTMKDLANLGKNSNNCSGFNSLSHLRNLDDN